MYALFKQLTSLSRWQALLADWPLFAEAFLTTVLVSVLALVLAMVLGVVFGLMSTSGKRVLRAVARVYVEFFQNTPLFLQAFFLYMVFPFLGLKMSVPVVGVLSVGVYTGAYISEVVRAGINSIQKGQFEAAYSQGFTYVQTMKEIILPQTVKIILPPLINQVANLIKNTSVMAMIGGGGLMYRTNDWANSGYMSYGPAYLVCGLLYFVLCFPMTRWAKGYEERLKSRDARLSEQIEKIEEETA